MDETEVGISILLKLLHRKKLSYLLSGIGGGKTGNHNIKNYS